MPSYQVQTAQLASNVASLTLDWAGALASGLGLQVEGVGSPYDGVHTLTGVDAATNVVTYSVAHADMTAADSIGVAYLPVTWITSDDVVRQLGVAPSTDEDYETLEDSVAAANDWSFERRYAAGYRDRPHLVPSNRVKLGAVLYAAALYKERGSQDSFASFQAMETGQPVGTMGQINRLLGLQRPAAS